MGNPAIAATPETDAEDTEQVDNDNTQDEELDGNDEAEDAGGEEEDEGDVNPEAAFEASVNKVVDAMKKDAKGNYVLPEGLSPEVKVAARAEKRRRDTQSDYTRTKQDKKRLEAEKATLLEMTQGTVTLGLTQEQKDELDELKFSDPEAWRKKMNNYEREALHNHRTETDKRLKQVSTSTLEKEELEERKQTLLDFNQKHGIEITDDVIANDVPPRIVKRLETGDVSFEAFLEEVHEYLKTGKVVVQTEKTRRQPNLSKTPGGSTPEKNAKKEDIIRSYDKEIF